MDLELDICRKVEWDSNYLKDIPLSEKEKYHIEESLKENLNVDDDYSLFLIGQYYYEQKEYEKAYHYFEIMSNRGDNQSKYKAAVMNYDGLGTVVNEERAFKMMLELTTLDDAASKHLLPAAHVNVGRAYFYGAGVQRDEKVAEKHWKIAANLPDLTAGAVVEAQMTLGLFYSLPDHKNLTEAFKYHKLAAAQGALESLGALGIMYLHGLGVAANDAKGFQFIKEAASKGSVYGKGMLVQFYYKRKMYTKCVEIAQEIIDLTDLQNISRKTECLEYFIRRGVSTACFIYARCLDQGLGVRKDEEAAKKYYSKSFHHDKKICFELHTKILHESL